jgi:HEAT repeat protein
MTLGRTILISIALTACLVAFFLFRVASDPEDTGGEESIETPSSLKRSDSPSQFLDTLPSSGDTEDKDSESQQLKLAKQLLESKKPSDRIEAAERLSAYPSLEMESMLLKALREDANSDVRNAAAAALGSLEDPSRASISGLLDAIDDSQENVRFSALSTLEDYLLGLDPQSPGFLAISNGLRSKLENRKLPTNLRASIREALKTQPSQ